MNVNKVILAGRLVRDPEVNDTPNGIVVTGSIATNRRVKIAEGNYKDDATFVEFVFFGDRAKLFGEKHKKGDDVFVEARLALDRWESGGKKHSKLKIVVTNFTFVKPYDGESTFGGRGRVSDSFAATQSAQTDRDPEADLDAGLDKALADDGADPDFGGYGS